MNINNIEKYILEKQESLIERGKPVFSISNNPLKNIMNLLKSEYGYLLPELLKCEKVYVEDILVNKIKHNTKYLHSLNNKNEFYADRQYLISGIVLYHRQRQVFQLIDGYHRTALNIKKNIINAKYIVLE